MFYAGATFVTRGHSFRTYDWSLGAAMVDKVMGSYERERSIPPERFSSTAPEAVPAIC